MYSSKTRSNYNKMTKKQIIGYAAVFAVVILVVVFVAIPDTIRSNERNRIREANNALIRGSSLIGIDTEADRRVAGSGIREPWIALRRDYQESDTRWTFLESSVEGVLTAEDLDGMKTLILCEEFVGFTKNYELIFNGTKQSGTVSRDSYGIRIRCIDLETGEQLGDSVTMDAKSLPARNPSDTDGRYDDYDIRQQVDRIVKARTVK